LIRILNWSGSMTPAQPLPLEESGSMPGGEDSAGRAGPQVEPVSQEELNAWRRGFTPQAEIWNGRLAMLGLSVGLAVLLIARLIPSP
jgi:hypothetical protein